MTINPDQIRAARALLKWSQNDLALRSGVSLPTIANIEVEKQQASITTQDKLAAAFDEAGIELIEGGVRKRQDIVKIFEGDDALSVLQEDIYQEVIKKPDDVLFLGLIESDPKKFPERYERTCAYIKRLQDIGVQEKILIESGTNIFVAPKEWYRCVPSEYFSPHTFVIYGDKIALYYKESFLKVMVIRSAHFTNALRRTYMMIWESAEKPK